MSEIRFKSHIPPDISAALVVVDVQNYFTNDTSPAFLPAAKEILPRLSKALSYFESANSAIYFTKHIDREENSPMLRFWRGKIEPDSPLSEIDDSLETRRSIIIEKNAYDAFYKTNMESSLREAGVNRLFFCGAVAHLCVESTVRSAFVQGFECEILADCLADYNYDAHYASLRSLGHGFASITYLEDIILNYE